jgi:hypothetical protein
MMLWPSLVEMDMMNGGYALRFVGLFVILCGLVVWWFYHAREATLSRIFSGRGLLAHWVYDPQQVGQHAAAELHEYWQRNRSLFIITTVLIVVIGVPVLVIPLISEGMLSDSDGIGLIIVALYFALIPLLGLVAYLTPRMAYRRALADGANVYVAEDGVFVGGALHTWRQPLSHLRQVTLERRGERTALRFDIRYFTKLGTFHYETQTLRVPVPDGQEEKAEEIVRRLSEQAGKK